MPRGWSFEKLELDKEIAAGQGDRGRRPRRPLAQNINAISPYPRNETQAPVTAIMGKLHI